MSYDSTSRKNKLLRSSFVLVYVKTVYANDVSSESVQGYTCEQSSLGKVLDMTECPTYLTKLKTVLMSSPKSVRSKASSQLQSCVLEFSCCRTEEWSNSS